MPSTWRRSSSCSNGWLAGPSSPATRYCSYSAPVGRSRSSSSRQSRMISAWASAAFSSSPTDSNSPANSCTSASFRSILPCSSNSATATLMPSSSRLRTLPSASQPAVSACNRLHTPQLTPASATCRALAARRALPASCSSVRLPVDRLRAISDNSTSSQSTPTSATPPVRRRASTASEDGIGHVPRRDQQFCHPTLASSWRGQAQHHRQAGAPLPLALPVQLPVGAALQVGEAPRLGQPLDQHLAATVTGQGIGQEGPVELLHLHKGHVTQLQLPGQAFGRDLLVLHQMHPVQLLAVVQRRQVGDKNDLLLVTEEGQLLHAFVVEHRDVLRALQQATQQGLGQVAALHFLLTQFGAIPAAQGDMQPPVSQHRHQAGEHHRHQQRDQGEPPRRAHHGISCSRRMVLRLTRSPGRLPQLTETRINSGVTL